MKSRATAVPRLIQGELAVFSKQDSQNTKKKQSKLVPKFHPVSKKNIFIRDLQIGNYWACRDKQPHHQLGQSQDHWPRSRQNHSLAQRSHMDQEQGQGHNEQGWGGIQIGQDLWPDYSQTSTFGVDDVITVIRGCQPVTHLHTESSEQGSWQELKYFEWVLLFIWFV